MNSSLRNNSLLRRKKKPFENDKGFFSTRKDLLKWNHREINIKKLTTEEKEIYRQETLKNNRIRAIRKLVILVILIAVVFLLSVFGIRLLTSKYNERQQIKEEILSARNTEQYNKYLLEAKELSMDEEWPMAIWQLKKAVEIFPNEIEAKLLLADVYQKCCTIEQIYCKDGINFLSKLIIEYPNNMKLIEMRAILYESTGQEAKALKDFESIGLDINND